MAEKRREEARRAIEERIAGGLKRLGGPEVRFDWTQPCDQTASYRVDVVSTHWDKTIHIPREWLETEDSMANTPLRLLCEAVVLAFTPVGERVQC